MIPPFNILLAEDDPADAYLVMTALSKGRFHCEVAHARDGMEALASMKSRVPDLVLLDINMPKKNGWEVLTEMRQDPALSSVPVVVLTTSVAERDVAHSWQSGANGYVAKPVELDALFAAIHGIEEYWFAITRLPRR